MKLLIITGTSKGLGLELARHALKAGYTVLGASRSASVLQNEENYHHLQLDLEKAEDRSTLMPAAVGLVSLQSLEAVYLVNNAALLEPLKAVERCSLTDVQAHLAVNLTAPIDLCAQFIKAFAWFQGEKKILNISSGSAIHPMPDMSLYCTTKAGLTMFSQCVALEQESVAWGVGVASLNPGMVETGMQVTARAQPESQFRPAVKFKSAKDIGRVKEAPATALKVLGLLETAPFKGQMLSIEG